MFKGTIASRKLKEYVAVAHQTTPYVTAYPWTEGTGFGTKYTNPATLPGGNARSAAFNSSPNTMELAIGHFSGIGMSIYPWSDSGFGTRYSDLGSVTNLLGTFFRLDCTAIAIVGTNSPFIEAWSWTLGSGGGSKFSNPATLPPDASNTNSGQWPVSYQGNDVMVGSQASPRIQIYPFNQSSFGTKYANPASSQIRSAIGWGWSRDGRVVFIGGETDGSNSRVDAYKFTSGTGFGTKYSASSSVGANSIQSVGHSGSDIAAISNNSPYVKVWPFSFDSGFGTAYADPATIVGNIRDVKFSRNGDTIFTAGSAAGDQIAAWPWSSSGFGTKYSAPATLPTGDGYAIAPNYWG